MNDALRHGSMATETPRKWTSPLNIQRALESFAESVTHSVLSRHLLFAGLTLFTVFFAGYHFGTFDQTIHIPFLQKFADPTLYPNDGFLELRTQHYSFFWFFLLPFYRMGVLEITMFIAHIGATYLTLWAFWAFGQTLFHDPLTSLVSVMVFAMPHLTFSAFPTLEFSLLNRTFVLPLLLWCLILYLRGHPYWTFFCMGLLYNLHVVSVNFAIAMVALDGVLKILRMGPWRYRSKQTSPAIRALIMQLFLFILGAAPVLIWKANGPPAMFRADPGWYSDVAAFFHHLFFLITTCPQVMLTSLNGFAMLALFAIARRRDLSPEHDHTMTHFVYAILIFLLTQLALTTIYPATFLLQLQITRAGLFGTIFGYLYFARYLVSRYRENSLNLFHCYWLLSATLTLIFPVVTLLCWGIAQLLPRPTRLQKLALVAMLLIVALGSVFLVIHEGLWGPGIHLYGPQSAWQEAQVWARENTPTDALFITPPHIWGLYETDWRVFSQRSTLVTYCDLLEIALVPSYITEWRVRFDKVAPGARSQFKDYFFDNQKITAAAFYSLTQDDIQRIAAEYAVSYLVIEHPHSYNLPIVYKNQEFVIYQIP